MKRLIAAIVILFGLLAVLLAQDGPGSVGSDTVARPRRPAVDTSAPSSSDAPAAASAPSAPAAPPADSTDLPKIPSKLAPKKEEGGPVGATFSADSSLVTVDVAVVDNKNNFVPSIPRDRFRILEDNVPQTIRQFSIGQAPLTVAVVVEFSNKFQWYGSPNWYYTLETVNAFLRTLKPNDFAAIIKYDLNEKIMCDFTNNPMQLQQALANFGFPDFSEANLFDALTDTADRMSKIEGRKAILILSSGIDTFSKLTFDQARRKLQDSGVPIYSIGLLQMINPGAMEGINQIQADSEMKTFTKESGGQAYFPRWPQEIGQVFQDIQGEMRNQYTLAYAPSNTEKDGKFRKITVQLIDPQTNQPIVMKDDKNKPIKYSIIAKQGYQAPRAVE